MGHYASQCWLLVRTSSLHYSGTPIWLTGRHTNEIRPSVVVAAPKYLGGATRMSKVAPSTPLSVHSLSHNHSFRIVIGPTRMYPPITFLFHLCSVAQHDRLGIFSPSVDALATV